MNSVKKILFISLRADLSGGPKHLNDLLVYFNDNMNKFEIYIAAPENSFFSDKYKNLSSDFFALEHRSFNLFTSFRLLSFCRRNNISLVHSHGRGAGIYSRLLGLFGIKVIHTFHGIHRESDLIGRLKFLFDYFTRHLVDQYICVSRQELQYAITSKLCVNSDVSLVENGINLELINKELETNPQMELISKYGLDVNSILLGVVARNDHVKGIDLLINHFRHFRKTCPEREVALFIVGAGHNGSNENNVFYLGELEAPIEFYNTIDFYVSSSRREGMPISVLEAMACGRPCLLSKVTGHVDLIEDSVSGFLFDAHSPDDFSKKLEKIIVCRSEEFVINAKKALADHHTVQVMGDKTYNLYFSS